MKLRMDHRSGEGNTNPATTVKSSDCQTLLTSCSERCRRPFAIGRQRAFAELRIWHIDDAALHQVLQPDCPQASPASKYDLFTSVLPCGRERVDRGPVCELSKHTVG